MRVNYHPFVDSWALPGLPNADASRVSSRRINSARSRVIPPSVGEPAVRRAAASAASVQAHRQPAPLLPGRLTGPPPGPLETPKNAQEINAGQPLGSRV